MYRLLLFLRPSISALKATELQKGSTDEYNLCHKTGTDAWFYTKEALFAQGAWLKYWAAFSGGANPLYAPKN